ncbi:DUF6087 family protein [Kitasatospora xanthocidica]|uniref:DUF6087 family protein n=1 Tax=Kitasatospora xanthocidica TaxID=83382 RepID=UPI0036E359ED
MLDPDETVSEWYAARAHRRRPPGTRDAIPLGVEEDRGRQFFEDIPRLVVEWDGSAWQPLAVADSYAEAYSLLVRRGGDLVAPQDDTPVELLRRGSGRHRRP